MSAVQDAGDHLFAVFQGALPISQGKAKTHQSTASGADRALARFYAEARAERDRRRFGIVGRARVAFYLQQRLLAAGYPPALVRQVLFSMLVSAFVGGQS